MRKQIEWKSDKQIECERIWLKSLEHVKILETDLNRLKKVELDLRKNGPYVDQHRSSTSRHYYQPNAIDQNVQIFKDKSNDLSQRYSLTSKNQRFIRSSTERSGLDYQKENRNTLIVQEIQPNPPQIPESSVKEEVKQPQTPEKVDPSPPKGKEQNDYAKLKEKYDKLQQQHKKSLQEINNLKQEIQQLQQEKNEMIPRSAKFFEGDVLDGFEDYKERLTQLIQQKFNAPIKKTKLLFRLEKDHPRNLHFFVDNHSPFVLIVKNKKEDREYHFACISQGALSPNSREQKRGWLISLTNGRVYPVANGKSAVLYDKNYLIFGNKELLIDGSSNKAFSNFGSSNSFYNTSGNDVRDFLGPGLQGTPRQAEVDSYQIFKVIF